MWFFTIGLFSFQTQKCNWRGHCSGAICVTENDCSGSLICTNNVCGKTTLESTSTIPIPKNTFTFGLKKHGKTTTTTISQTTATTTISQATTTTTISQATATTTISQATATSGTIPITSGTSAVLTYFTDTVFQCITGQPTGNAMAVNPLLLGFTASEWTNLYANADPSVIPWCGKTMTITVNGKSFTGTIIDTCDRNL
jgi:hypothetical protein